MACANDLVLSITALAVALADGKTPDDLALMGAAFTQLGDTLTTISTQRALCEQNEKAPDSSGIS